MGRDYVKADKGRTFKAGGLMAHCGTEKKMKMGGMTGTHKMPRKPEPRRPEPAPRKPAPRKPEPRKPKPRPPNPRRSEPDTIFIYPEPIGSSKPPKTEPRRPEPPLLGDSSPVPPRRSYQKGGKVRGYGKARGGKPCKMV